MKHFKGLSNRIESYQSSFRSKLYLIALIICITLTHTRPATNRIQTCIARVKLCHSNSFSRSTSICWLKAAWEYVKPTFHLHHATPPHNKHTSNVKSNAECSFAIQSNVKLQRDKSFPIVSCCRIRLEKSLSGKSFSLIKSRGRLTSAHHDFLVHMLH